METCVYVRYVYMHGYSKQIHTCMDIRSKSIYAWIFDANPYMHGYSKQIHTCMDIRSKSIYAWIFEANPCMDGLRHAIYERIHACIIYDSIDVCVCIVHVCMYE